VQMQYIQRAKGHRLRASYRITNPFSRKGFYIKFRSSREKSTLKLECEKLKFAEKFLHSPKNAKFLSLSFNSTQLYHRRYSDEISRNLSKFLKDPKQPKDRYPLGKYGAEQVIDLLLPYLKGRN
jgi:hypothetical protein